MKINDLTGDQYGRLTVISQHGHKDKRITWLCKCECGNEILVKGVYLTTGEVRSCGCLKKSQDHINLRDQYDKKRVDGVAKQLFKGKEPRKDSGTGYRGVIEYRTRVSKEIRYRAWITVNGKIYKKAGFKTAEEAYYNGRLLLERLQLPK